MVMCGTSWRNIFPISISLSWMAVPCPSIVAVSGLPSIALLDREALEIGNMLGVDKLVRENLDYMAGTTWYLFEPGLAKGKVLEAVEKVNASPITRMVSMQASDRAKNPVLVHYLVLWKVGNDFRATPRLELVSRYTERLEANKLCLESAAKLKSLRQDISALLGAEGYAGTLFEAYAIQMIQAGCTLDMSSMEDGRTVKTLCIPPFSSNQ